MGHDDGVWVNTACMALIAISAMLYGAYAVQIKVEVSRRCHLPPYPDRIDAQTCDDHDS